MTGPAMRALKRKWADEQLARLIASHRRRKAEARREKAEREARK
jgi:hypothetical protein